MRKNEIELPPLPDWMNRFQIPSDDQDEAEFNWLDYRMKEYALAAIKADRQRRGEPVAWHTEGHLTVKSATTYDPVVAEWWIEKGWTVTPLFYAPQPAENSVNLEVAIQAISALLSNDTDWDTSYWNQAVGRCVSELNKLRSQQPAP